MVERLLDPGSLPRALDPGQPRRRGRDAAAAGGGAGDRAGLRRLDRRIDHRLQFHRGCLALVYRPPDLAPPALHGARRLLGIENIANPDNIGGLFRTAAAFAVDGVVLDTASGDPLYRKAVRTSMGASLRVPYARAGAWLPALAELRERGFRIVAMTPAAGAHQLSDFAATVTRDERLVVLVGAEGAGLGDDTLAVADVAVRIPIDAAVDSLNVVVAAGIALRR